MEGLATKPIRIKRTLKATKVTLKNTPTIEKVVVKDTPSIENDVLKTLEYGKIRNDIFVGIVLKGITDKQERLVVLKKIYNMKENKVIKQIYINGVVYIQIVK